MIINEQIQIEDFLSGKESFRIFLYIANKFNLTFIKSSYLNTSDYYYFFFTDSIPDNKMLSDELELKKSLRYGYLTFSKMKDRVISFYVGVKDNIFEYGFFDASRRVVYKIGKFEVDDTYLRKLPNHKCFKHISTRLAQARLENMKLLHEIKEDIEDFYEDKNGNIKILDEFRIKKSFNQENFSKIDMNKFTTDFKEYISEMSWFQQIKYSVSVGEEYIHFYIELLQ